MRTKHLLPELIDLLLEYEQQLAPEAEPGLTDFLMHVRGKDLSQELMQHFDLGVASEEITSYRSLSGDIAILVLFLYRYSKTYLKQVLKDSPLQTIEDFSFMMGLLSDGPSYKMALIDKQVVERTSGVEVIKRLLRLGMISEKVNETDRRSKQVAVTDHGRNTVYALMPAMARASDAVVGDLSQSEIEQLHRILAKLEAHHQHLFTTGKEEALSALTEPPEKGASPKEDSGYQQA